MPISEKDQEFMQRVAEYYESTKDDPDAEGSIRETAIHFDINRVKVRKILITEGLLSSPITENAVHMRADGMTIQEIASALGISASTVSTYLPYTDKVDSSLDPSPHAERVRKYRAYEKQQKQRQKARKELAAEERCRTADAADDRDGRREESMDESWKKEWEKDKKMSYTEAYHRPRRETWEDAERLRERLRLDKDSRLREWQTQYEEKRCRMEAEYCDLRSRADLTGTESDRLAKLTRELGMYPGALSDRNRAALEALSGERLPFSPARVLRLHLELWEPGYPDAAAPDAETADILKRYGEVEHGDTISRDILVPSDLPLYALHYVIQKAFGWQNSHLHQFSLPRDRARVLCHDNASMWSTLVGLVFRSPLMGEEDEFWMDDYTGGSFKNWLRKKYTGPYLSLCYGEGLLPCQEDMMRLDMKQEFYVCYERAKYARNGRGKEYLSQVIPVEERSGKGRCAPKDAYRTERMRLEQLPVECLARLFERDPLSLLERIPIDSVLAPSENGLGDEDKAEYCITGEEMYEAVGSYVRNIIRSQEDAPEAQVCPPPFTDILYYSYDFGDDWTVAITASRNCEDLMDRLTQDQLDKAQIKCRELYRPVLLDRDGVPVMDDVGGLHGFTEFLQTIHPHLDRMDSFEKAEAKETRKEYLEWAKGQGWMKDKTSNSSFL